MSSINQNNTLGTIVQRTMRPLKENARELGIAFAMALPMAVITVYDDHIARDRHYDAMRPSLVITSSDPIKTVNPRDCEYQRGKPRPLECFVDGDDYFPPPP